MTLNQKTAKKRLSCPSVDAPLNSQPQHVASLMSAMSRLSSRFTSTILFQGLISLQRATTSTNSFLLAPASSRVQVVHKMTSIGGVSNGDASIFKRAKLEEKVSDFSIGTHSGTFQADEAMGVWMLRQHPRFRNSKVVRSRDASVLDKLDIVIDVGGVYDHSKLRYDHHQRGYDERFDKGKPDVEGGRCTKLSASGLVYRHYGKDVIKSFYPSLPEDQLDLAYVKLYDSLLEALDAIDTGVEPAPEGVLLLYKDSTGLSSRVSRLNPRWNEIDADGRVPDPDQRFEEACKVCGEEFLSGMTKIIESDLPARVFVEKAVLDRYSTDASGEIISLESGGLPWRNHLYEIEKEVLKADEALIKFVLYQDQAGMWRVQAVTVEGRGFENRLSLPEEWRGVRDEELASVTKIAGSRFVHAAGFIGGNDTYEGALEMARVALKRK